MDISGPRLSTLAWRNIWRNRRRTIITLVSIAFGTLLATLFTGLGDASYADMIDYAAKLGGGHVVIEHPDARRVPSFGKTVTGTDRIREALAEDPRVRAVVPRIRGSVMLATSTNNVGVVVLGIDPTVEGPSTLGFIDAIVEGEMFTGDGEGIVVGRKLAENLDLALGNKVVFTVTDKSGEIANGLARVTGILETGAPEIDAGTCLLPLPALQRTLGYAEDEVSQIAVFLDDHRPAHAVAAHVRETILPRIGTDATALPWDRAMPEIASFVTMKTTSTLLLELIVTLLIAAGIFNTLFVSVMERMRELGILAAIGFSFGQLFTLVLWESFWIAVCGLVTGVLLTAGPYAYLRTYGIDVAAMSGGQATQVAGVTMSPILYVEIYPNHALVIVAAILLATMAAGLYPAFRAGRVSPVDAIRIV